MKHEYLNDYDPRHFEFVRRSGLRSGEFPPDPDYWRLVVAAVGVAAGWCAIVVVAWYAWMTP
jgi:hypothetical protein